MSAQTDLKQILDVGVVAVIRAKSGEELVDLSTHFWKVA